MTFITDRRNVLKGGLSLGAGLVAGLQPGRLFAQTTIPLTFSVWGSDAEVAAYNQVIAKYQAANPNVSIKLDVMPFGQFYQQVDTRLAGRQAPDLFRVTYQQVGRYAKAKAAIDLGEYLDAGYADAFTPAVWGAVNYEGATYALPHHTDTFALYYNADLLEKAGIALPTKLDDAWTWAQFIENARGLKEKSIGTHPFAMAWQNSAVHRWMIYLYQHGGKLLADDLASSAINTPSGIETIAWTQSWFKEGLVPPSTSLKSGEKVQNLFANGIIPMMLNGNWQIPFLEKQAKFRWGVTYLPRDVAMADDLGGTSVAISRDCKEPEAAAEFLKFLVDEENMRDYVNAAQFLPVRKSLVEGGIQYTTRPEEMKVFVEQTKTVPPHLVSTVILPSWGKFSSKLADELDLAFTSGQTPEETAENIEGYVNDILISS
ncbi:MAG: sugar ABC transporter substrate-binding protein [Rhizobiaceae bacterium]|nr:sugar ABC transporter substrate-binding protein [Rhizobiaceae bacterium]